MVFVHGEEIYYPVTVSYLREKFRSKDKMRSFGYTGIKFSDGTYYFGTNRFYPYKDLSKLPDDFKELESYLSFSKDFHPISWLAFLDWLLKSDKLVKEFCTTFGRLIRKGGHFTLAYRNLIRTAMSLSISLDSDFPKFVIYCNRLVSVSFNGGIKYKDREPSFDRAYFMSKFELNNISIDFEPFLKKLSIYNNHVESVKREKASRTTTISISLEGMDESEKIVWLGEKYEERSRDAKEMQKAAREARKLRKGTPAPGSKNE